MVSPLETLLSCPGSVCLWLLRHSNQMNPWSHVRMLSSHWCFPHILFLSLSFFFKDGVLLCDSLLRNRNNQCYALPQCKNYWVTLLYCPLLRGQELTLLLRSKPGPQHSRQHGDLLTVGRFLSLCLLRGCFFQTSSCKYDFFHELACV